MTDAGDITLAVRALREGKLAAFPTETVYGLGGDATSEQVVAEIFAVKGRPRINPLIVHVESLDKARLIGRFDDDALLLARRFWPGPLTLVVPRSADCPVCSLASAGLDSIALRVPAHPVARKLLKAFARPVAAPSANLSGRLSPSTSEHVREEFGDRIGIIVDGGSARVGLESTVVSCLSSPPVLLRPGGLNRADVENALGRVLKSGGDDERRPRSPGQSGPHYAPAATVRLNVQRARDAEAFLTFGPRVPEHSGPGLNLSPDGDVVEAAANLFAYLRWLDARAEKIAVMPIPNHGLGEAINDRLKRAAMPRSLDLSGKPS